MRDPIDIPEGYGEPFEPRAPFTIDQPVAWSELDAYRHVNHAVYLTYFENGRFHYFEVVGVTAMHEAEGKGPILARCEIDYLAPVEFPDRLLVKTWASEIGNTSFVLESEIWSCRDARAVARGRFVIVLVDYEGDYAKVRVPEPVRAAIRALDADVVER